MTHRPTVSDPFEAPPWFATLWELAAPRLAAHLTADDDPGFWRAALGVIAGDVEHLAGAAPGAGRVVVELGCCARWLRPHQTRWRADGGFAWPDGYDHGRPEHAWACSLARVAPARWELVPGEPLRRACRLRASLPARTARHAQAAVHTVWTHGPPGGPREPTPYLYGFRKREGVWSLVADGGFDRGPSRHLFTA